MIKTQELSIGYQSGRKNRKIIAENLNLNTSGGDCIALLGRNGIGKSTLLKTLSGIIPPLGGRIWLAQKDLKELKIAEKAQLLSLILTEKIHLGYFKVINLVSLGRYPYTDWLGKLQADDLAIVENALELTGMSKFRDTDFIRLSDGEKQKVLIARALAQDTPLMILDEPSSHLDYPSRMMIFELLQNLAYQTQKSILIATHELEMAVNYCNKVWLMYPGEDNKVQIESGLPEELYLKQSFEKLFKPFSYTISLNSVNSLKEKRSEANKLLTFSGDQTGIFWTQKALKKAPLIHLNKEIHIGVEHLETDQYRWMWYVQGRKPEEIFYSLEDLIHSLSLHIHES